MSNKYIVKDMSVYFKDRNIKISAINSINQITDEDRSFINRILHENLAKLIYLDGHIYLFSSLIDNLNEFMVNKTSLISNKCPAVGLTE
jgi:hypothetical protein